MKAILFILIIFTSGCATTNIDEKTTAESKTQCPVGYHLVQTGGVVIFASSNDKNKHSMAFKCIVDSLQDQHINSDVNQ